jgi:phage shock protein C
MQETSNTHKRLYKSRQNRIIDGVCGGVSEYFGVDPTIVRLLWVLVTLMGGSGFFLYILAMIIMPVNPEHIGAAAPAMSKPNGSDRKRFFGVMLILMGLFVLLINLGAESSWWWISWKIMLPILLILFGGLFIYIYANKRGQDASAAQTAEGEARAPRELFRSSSDRKLFGVCSGIARYFDLDPTIVRILFVCLVLASFGWALLLYIIMGIVMPQEKVLSKSA